MLIDILMWIGIVILFGTAIFGVMVVEAIFAVEANRLKNLKENAAKRQKWKDLKRGNCAKLNL